LSLSNGANSNEKYSKYSRRPNFFLGKRSIILTVARLTSYICVIIIGYLIALTSKPYPYLSKDVNANYWENRKPASSTLKQIYESRNCDEILKLPRPIYSKENWQKFYDIWKKHGGRGDPDFVTSDAPPDFVRPTEAGETDDGKGRGVFATSDIKKGEMIYGQTTNYAYFSNGYSFQRFLEALTDDGEACDIMKFSWPQSGFGPNGETAIVCVMDENSFMNDGGAEKSNFGCIGEEEEDCSMVS
jgi:hypothetical protein